LVQTGSHTIAPFVVTVDDDPLRDFSGVAPLAVRCETAHH